MSILLEELKQYASATRKKSNEWFFKTGPGQYGEGDQFIGVGNPDVRKVVKKFADLGLEDIRAVMDSEIHEERLAGILLLVGRYGRAVEKRERLNVAQFYIRNLDRVNNWDLVDLSAHRILGQAILDKIFDEKVLDTLAVSKNLWERRVAIIATMGAIDQGEYRATLRIAEKLLGDHEDLIHKAVGWALREVWKRDKKVCEQFLLEHYSHLPRTTLRYAIERMEEKKRKRFLLKKNH